MTQNCPVRPTYFTLQVLPKLSNCSVRPTPKKQNCPVRPEFLKIVLLDRLIIHYMYCKTDEIFQLSC